jgi:hypothetical protein
MDGTGDIILSEVSQVQKTKDYMFSLTCGRQTSYKYKQCSEKQVTQRRCYISKREIKEES